MSTRTHVPGTAARRHWGHDHGHHTCAPSPRAATPRQLAWLRGELAEWTREGLLDPAQAEVLLGRYRAARRLSVGRLLLLLGAGFVGVGVIWLVAANLDQLTRSGASCS